MNYFRRKCLELWKKNSVPLDLNRSCLHIFNHFCPLNCAFVSVFAAYKVSNHSRVQLISSHLIFCLYFIGVSCRLMTHAWYSILKAIFMWYFVLYILKRKNSILRIFLSWTDVSRTNKRNENIQTIWVVELISYSSIN